MRPLNPPRRAVISVFDLCAFQLQSLDAIRGAIDAPFKGKGDNAKTDSPTGPPETLLPISSGAIFDIRFLRAFLCNCIRLYLSELCIIISARVRGDFT